MKNVLFAWLCCLGFIEVNAQIRASRWHPFAGLHAAGDAALAHIGPSPQLGIDYRFTSRLALSNYVQYFGSSYKSNTAGLPDLNSSARYRSVVAEVLLDINFHRAPSRGFSVAAGPAFHTSTETYTGPGDNTPWRRNYLTASARLAFALPAGKQGLSIELNLVGPWQSKTGPAPFYTQSTDILSQLSLGGRWLF